jgi:hypothetical protein
MGMKPLCRVSLFALAITLTASAAIAANPLTGFKSVNVDLPLAGLVPAISLREAQSCPYHRDRRTSPAMTKESNLL